MGVCCRMVVRAVDDICASVLCTGSTASYDDMLLHAARICAVYAPHAHTDLSLTRCATFAWLTVDNSRVLLHQELTVEWCTVLAVVDTVHTDHRMICE
jgi:hypothetical protein